MYITDIYKDQGVEYTIELMSHTDKEIIGSDIKQYICKISRVVYLFFSSFIRCPLRYGRDG